MARASGIERRYVAVCARCPATATLDAHAGAGAARAARAAGWLARRGVGLLCPACVAADRDVAACKAERAALNARIADAARDVYGLAPDAVACVGGRWVATFVPPIGGETYGEFADAFGFDAEDAGETVEVVVRDPTAPLTRGNFERVERVKRGADVLNDGGSSW